MSKRKRQWLGQAMGQAIVGFDYQVFRTTKPPPDLVEEARAGRAGPRGRRRATAIDLPPLPGETGDGAPDDRRPRRQEP